jgi:methyl-accepting chemotaxis protein
VQQFLQDVSATRGLDGLDDGFKNAAAQRDEFLAGLKRFKEMYEREQDSVHLKEVAELEEAFARYYQAGHGMASVYVKEGPTAGNKLMAEFDKAASSLTEALELFVQQQTDELKNSLTAVEVSSHKTALAALFGGVLLTVGTVLLAFYSIRSIVGPLQKIASQVGENAGSVSASAGELSAASQTVAEGASEQAASLEETSASLEEISSMTKRNADNASNGSQLGKQARESAAAGLNRIADLSHTLDSIKSAVTEMQSAVAETQSSSQEISKIIKTIDEIAFQTNLLALNAAVEAARAGEAGMGFAVVADEVRALAQRSAQAAKDTADKIESAVKRSELGGVASTKVVKSLAEVATTAQSIQQVFTGIVTQIKSLDEVIAEIAAASKEQNQGISEVNMAVSQMDKVTQSNAAAAEENAASAATLNSQSNRLLAAVSSLHEVIEGQIQAVAAPTKPGQQFRSAKQLPHNRDVAHATIGNSPRAKATHSLKPDSTVKSGEFQNF